MADDNTMTKENTGIEVIINDDGTVTFVNLPPELADLARSLDPDAVLACALPAKKDDAGEQEEK